MFKVFQRPVSKDYTVCPSDDRQVDRFTYAKMCKVLDVTTRELVEELSFAGATIKVNRNPREKVSLTISFKSEQSAARWCAVLNAKLCEK